MSRSEIAFNKVNIRFCRALSDETEMFLNVQGMKSKLKSVGQMKLGPKHPFKNKKNRALNLVLIHIVCFESSVDTMTGYHWI